MLSLTMICKDALEDLKRLQPLVQPYIDEWVVVFPPDDPAIAWAEENNIIVIVKDFTQPIEPDIQKQMADAGVDVPKDYRLFNFAAARNASLEAATSDYVLWLDADDTPIGLDNVKRFIEKYPDYDSYDAVYDYFHDEEGNAASDHYRERVVVNNGHWEWKGGELGLIHETLLPKDYFEPQQQTFPDNIFRVEHNSDHIQESSLRNHAALLYEYLKTEGKDPRTTYYLGIEFFNRKLYTECIGTLLEFLPVTGSEEDKYAATLKIAEAYRMLNEDDAAIFSYLQAQVVLPNRPDAYLGLGEVYHDHEEWARSTDYLLTGLQKQLPRGKHGVDRMAYTFRPAGYLALNYLQLDKPKEAYDWFTKAAAMNPKHPWVQDKAPLFTETKDLTDYVTNFVKLAQLTQKLYPKTLHKLAEVIPDDLLRQEILMDFHWRYAKPQVWSKNSVVVFCSHAFEDWGPESLERGCGGSEEAVIHLTKRWAKMGYDVTVFNNCAKEQVVDGVKWVRFERFNPRDIFNVLISWRNNIFTEAPTARVKLIDVHDVPELKFYHPTAVEGVKIAVKSQYHRNLFPDLPDEQFVIIPNGVNLEQFANPKKTKNNLVWTSSYDRGLENLLEMWPDIRKEVPDATLDVYYGFALYDQTPWGKRPAGQVWKQKMLKLLDQPGVTDHGRVGQDVVAEAYKKADVWAYPTVFPEIDCITATKSMAGGAVPITTDAAVLPERNQGILVPGEIATNKERFKTELIALLKDDGGKAELREKIDVSAFDWQSVAQQWADRFPK